MREGCERGRDTHGEREEWDGVCVRTAIKRL